MTERIGDHCDSRSVAAPQPYSDHPRSKLSSAGEMPIGYVQGIHRGCELKVEAIFVPQRVQFSVFVNK
jgi:hypothetical protein